MFAELHAVARHTPLTLIITPQGERLSVIITPRPGTKKGEDNPALSQPIRAVGTPAELDAELPAKLVEYSEKVNALRLSIDLPVDALDAAKVKAEKKPAAKPAETASKSPLKRKAAAKAAPKEKHPRSVAARKAGDRKREERATREAAAAKKVTLPGVSKASTKPKAPRAQLTREELLAACRDLIAKHGDKVDREFFIKHVPGGRRYEREFASFKEMIALASQRDLALDPASDEVEKPAEPAAPAGAEPSTTRIATADAWPFPCEPLAAPAAAESAAPPAAAPAASNPPEPPKPAEAEAADPVPKGPFTPLANIAGALVYESRVNEQFAKSFGRFTAGFEIHHTTKTMNGRAWIDVGGFEFDEQLPERPAGGEASRTAIVAAAVTWLDSLITIQSAKAKTAEDRAALVQLAAWARTFTPQAETAAA